MAGFGDTPKRGRPSDRLSAAEKMRRARDKDRLIALPPVANPARRARLEKPGNETCWLMHYMSRAYPAPFSPGHVATIYNTIHAARTGEGTGTAQPRGEGKTTVLRGVSMYLIALKIVRFPVLVGWKYLDASAAFQSWLRMLCDSPEFAADYPELCTPFQHSPHATRLKSLMWEHTEKRIGAMVNSMDKIITLPDSIGAIAARSAQGDAKGLSVVLLDGTVLRPDFLLFDDAQDPNAAHNPARVAATIDKLENVFLGMAGPQDRISAAAACTVEAEDDVSCHWLNREGWTATRISRIMVWPDGSKGGTWEHKDDCEIKALWDEWWSIYTDPDGGQKQANKHFRKHRKTMTGKMEVSWKHRFKKGWDVCAIDAAMRDWYKMGPDVFSRGQQNNPIKQGTTIFNITPKVIIERADAMRNAGEIPEWSRGVFAATDINPSYGLTTIIAAFGVDQRAAVLWYGVYKTDISKDMTEAQKKAAIMAALQAHGLQLAALPCRPSRWIIDGGGSPIDTVITFAANSVRTVGIESVCAFGRAWRQVRSRADDRKYEHAFIRAESSTRRWCIWNADYWKEIAQKSWLAAIGAPGSCDLPKGNHREFAEQICREQLAGKAETAGTWVYVWHTQPGAHDYGDCMAMIFAMAAMSGIGTGGEVIRKGKRKAAVIIGGKRIGG